MRGAAESLRTATVVSHPGETGMPPGERVRISSETTACERPRPGLRVFPPVLSGAIRYGRREVSFQFRNVLVPPPRAVSDLIVFSVEKTIWPCWSYERKNTGSDRNIA